MKKVFEMIFNENEFTIRSSNSDFTFLNNQNFAEYFILSKYQLKEIEEFFSCHKTNKLINYFDEMKKESLDISKNTSLILLVELNTLEDDYNALKNQVYRIEEDEYFFKKYVICYTEEMIDNIDCDKNLTEFFHRNISEMNLDLFRKDRFHDILDFLTVQVFIKLPFMNYDIERDDFELIEEILSNRIEKKGLTEIRKTILDSSIEENLLNEFMKKDEKNESVINFFEKYKGIL